MDSERFWYWRGESLVLRCQVQPRASRDELVGEHGGRLRIRIRAVPAEGAANRQLQRFLAETFGVAPGAVAIEKGQGTRLKTATVRDPRRLPEALGIAARSSEAARR